MNQRAVRCFLRGPDDDGSEPSSEHTDRAKPSRIPWEKSMLVLWFTLNLGLGLLKVHQYGISLDEPNNYRYAADTLDAYKSFFGALYEPAYDSSYDGHGPVFVAGVAILAGAIQGLFPGLFEPDIWHYAYFLAFQCATLCLYSLTKRWFNTWTAWGILVLFGTQPLLMGHAFINPKDVPFMFFFIMSVLLGFRLSDGAGDQGHRFSLNRSSQVLVQAFREGDSQSRRNFVRALRLALATALLLVVFRRSMNSLLESAVRHFYDASPDSTAGQIFSLVAAGRGAVGLEDYVLKAQRLLQSAGRDGLLLGILVFLAYFCLAFPAVMRAAWDEARRLAVVSVAFVRSLGSSGGSLSLRTVMDGLVGVVASSREPRLILAGVVLGLATGVRAIAPWAGVIVVLHLLITQRSRAWRTGAAYFFVAAVVTYITWPRLWGAPLQRFLEGVGVISDFPGSQRVLFDGRLYAATDLPGSYLFTLLNIQFTETLLLAIYTGLAILGWRIVARQVPTDLLLYVGLGFVGPLLAWSVLRSPLYDNFRQLLFLIPAMVVLAAFALEPVLRVLGRTWARVCFIVALALPGLYSSARLFPYEYTYYNSLIGGLGGAQGRFEVDPWRTSLREVALELNQRATSGALILAGPWSGFLQIYARPDLRFAKIYNSTSDLKGEYDYVVEMPKFNPWVLEHPTETIMVVERDGAVLAGVKAVDNAGAQ